MGMVQASRRCDQCKVRTLHHKKRLPFSGTAGMLVSILTFGLFLPIWFLIEIAENYGSGRWRCQRCGHARGDRYRDK
jgi:hypothetical protein